MSEVTDVIENEPKTVGIIPVEKMSLFAEYRPILSEIKKRYMTAKDIWALYYDEETKQHTKGQKTIYRWIHKLVEEGLIMEVGYRESPSSRNTETLYGPFARVIFYENPQIMEEWKSEKYKDELKLMHLLTQEQLEKSIDFDDFYEVAIRYIENQDTVSSELLTHVDDNPDILELLQTVPTHKISNLVFLTTNIVILAEKLSIFE